MRATKVHSVRKFKAGYEIRDETVDTGVEPLRWKRAYTPSGDYIGSSRWAHRLCAQRGIAPEKSNPAHSVCSIGFSEREQKWYGWSHRALFGFGIGYTAEQGSLPTESGYIDGYLEEHPELDRRVPVGFKVETLDDARRVAVAFAGSVS